MKIIVTFLITIFLQFVSGPALSLSCGGIIEEFYFSCTASDCKAEFRKSYKKSGGLCERRSIFQEVDQDIASYLSSEIKASGIKIKDGIYKLNISFWYWGYKPANNVDTLKLSIANEFRQLPAQTASDQTPIGGSIRNELNAKNRGISLEYVGENEPNSILNLKQALKKQQYYELFMYLLHLAIYWGLSIISLIAVIYSINRFFFRYFTQSKVDKRSLSIQIAVLISSVLSIVVNPFTFWPGAILLPAVAVILVAEIWLIIRARFSKKAR